MAMKLGTAGKKLIKSFEGCRLTAYKAVSTEKYWTIGWGHYGPDIRQGQKITQGQADALFDKDIQKYVNYVNALNMDLNQNQFDALVSFCYNCGPGNLKTLVSNGSRNAETIAIKIVEYNKSGGKVLNGLVRRRAAEKKLFDTPVKSNGASTAKKSTAATSTVKNTSASKAASTKKYHTVVKGDTVSALAIKNKTTIAQIKKINKLDDDYTIQVGQKLRVK